MLQVLQSVTDCYYKVLHALQSYFKVWQKSTTKCVRYYKVWQVLQSVTDCYYKARKVLQSVPGIAKWDGYYTVRRNKGNFLCIAIDVHILWYSFLLDIQESNKDSVRKKCHNILEVLQQELEQISMKTFLSLHKVKFLSQNIKTNLVAFLGIYMKVFWAKINFDWNE